MSGVFRRVSMNYTEIHKLINWKKQISKRKRSYYLWFTTYTKHASLPDPDSSRI
jgi:hypothetical protein